MSKENPFGIKEDNMLANYAIGTVIAIGFFLIVFLISELLTYPKFRGYMCGRRDAKALKKANPSTKRISER